MDETEDSVLEVDVIRKNPFVELAAADYNMTTAVADAGAMRCEQQHNQSEEAISRYMIAFVDASISLYGKLVGDVDNPGHYEFPCHLNFTNHTEANRMVPSCALYAWANNYEGTCEDVMSSLNGGGAPAVTPQDMMQSSLRSACSQRAPGSSVSPPELRKHALRYKPLHSAVEHLLDIVAGSCPCPEPYLCCSTCDPFVSCPGGRGALNPGI